MASSIAHGRIRTATIAATESRNMAAILFTVYFFDIGHPCYEQLSPAKTRYLLTSIM